MFVCHFGSFVVEKEINPPGRSVAQPFKNKIEILPSEQQSLRGAVDHLLKPSGRNLDLPGKQWFGQKNTHN